MNQNNSADNGYFSVSVSPSSGISSLNSVSPSQPISPTADQAHPSALDSLIELYKTSPVLLSSLFSGNPSVFGFQPLMNNASIMNPSAPMTPNYSIHGFPNFNPNSLPNTANVLLRPRSPTSSPVSSYASNEPDFEPSIRRAALVELYKTLSGAFDPPVLKTSATAVSSGIVPEFPPNAGLYNHFNNHSPSKGNGWKREWNEMSFPRVAALKPSKEEQCLKVRFQPFQIEALKEKTKTTEYLTTEELEKLELETGLTKDQILDWFSYQRNKQDMNPTDEKKKNVRFTDEQKAILRPHFVPGRNVPMSKCRMLGAHAGMTSQQVRGWFSKQNQSLRLAEERKKNREKQEEK